MCNFWNMKLNTYLSRVLNEHLHGILPLHPCTPLWHEAQLKISFKSVVCVGLHVIYIHIMSGQYRI